MRSIVNHLQHKVLPRYLGHQEQSQLVACLLWGLLTPMLLLVHLLLCDKQQESNSPLNITLLAFQILLLLLLLLPSILTPLPSYLILLASLITSVSLSTTLVILTLHLPLLCSPLPPLLLLVLLLPGLIFIIYNYYHHCNY